MALERKIYTNKKLMGSEILNESGDAIINKDGGVETNNLEVKGIDGEVVTQVFESVPIFGVTDAAYSISPVDSGNNPMTTIFQSRDIVMTVGLTSGDTCPPSGTTTGVTQFIISEDSNPEGGVKLLSANSEGIYKSFITESLNSAGLLNNSILGVRSAENIQLVSESLEKVQIINNDNGDKFENRSTHGGYSQFLGVGNRSRSVVANIIASTNDVVHSSIDKISLFGSNDVIDSVTLNVSGGTGTTVTETKMLKDGGPHDITVGSGVARVSIFNSISNVSNGVTEASTNKYTLLNADSIEVVGVLHISGDTGTTITETKSMSNACDCDDLHGSAFTACNRRCARNATTTSKSSTITSVLDGVLEVYASKLDSVSADDISDSVTLHISGDTGNTVTTVKSQGGGEGNCDTICSETHPDISSDNYKACVRGCKRGSVSNNTKILGSTDGLTGVRSDKVNIVANDNIYDAIKLYISGDTGSTVTETKSMLSAGNELKYATGRPHKAANVNSISSTSGGVLEASTDNHAILYADSYDVIQTLRISGDTGNTVTTVKSTNTGSHELKLATGPYKTSFNSNNISSTTNGILDSSVDSLKVLSSDIYGEVITLKASGDTGNTVTETKSLTSVNIDSLVPIGRGQRELVDGGNNNYWEILKGLDSSELYQLTYSSTTGTVETMISTVTKTELHNKALKITDSLVSVPALKINTIAGGASVANLGITSDGTVISGTSGCNVCKYVESFLFTGDTTSTITHNLGNEDVQVQLKDSTGNLIIPNSVNNYTTNTVDIKVSITGTYRIIILG